MQSTGYMRQVTQALHAIAEQLAAKEIDIAPQQFLNRETIKRSMSKMNRPVEEVDWTKLQEKIGSNQLQIHTNMSDIIIIKNDLNMGDIPRVIGIDLGTKNSCVGLWYPQNNQVKILHNQMGENTTPSFVGYRGTSLDDMQITVGKNA